MRRRSRSRTRPAIAVLAFGLSVPAVRAAEKAPALVPRSALEKNVTIKRADTKGEAAGKGGSADKSTSQKGEKYGDAKGAATGKAGADKSAGAKGEKVDAGKVGSSDLKLGQKDSSFKGEKVGVGKAGADIKTGHKDAKRP